MQKQNTITFFHTEATQFLEKVSRFTASKWISIMAESNWIVRCLENNYEDLWQNCNFIIHLHSNYKC